MDRARSSNVRPKAPKREPLTRDRVLRAALVLADESGLDAVTMRAVGQRLQVEAMSLYKHVANKEEILDGLSELVFAEMLEPPRGMPWREALRLRAVSARSVLLRHRWAASLIESRIASGPMRLRHLDGVLRALREGGFSVALAYAAFLTIDSYIYGFVMQEVAWPFEPDERPEIIEEFRPMVSEVEYPHIIEMMTFAFERGAASLSGGNSRGGYDADFAFGLELVLDGLDRARAESATMKEGGR